MLVERNRISNAASEPSGSLARWSDMFTSEPNLTPYTALPTDSRVFDPARARIARPKTAKEKTDLADIDDSQKIRKNFQKRPAPHSDRSQTMPKQQ
jgi:hypothetical protein